MKKLIICTIIQLGCLNFCYPITWELFYDSALKKAKQTNKPLLIDFYTDWCGWCKELDKQVYPDPKINELAKKFIFLKVDCEKDTATAKKYSINSYPTIYILDPHGKVIEQVNGYRDKDEFLALMKGVLAKTQPIKNDTSAESETIPLSDAQNKKASQFYQLGQKMEQVRRYPQAINYYTGVIRLAPNTALAEKAKKRIKLLKNQK